MDKGELQKIRKMIANESHALSTPIDFEKLIEQGLIKKVGNSFYTNNIKDLPSEVTKKIKDISKGRYGLKLTFYKETKSIKKLSIKLKQYRE